MKYQVYKDFVEKHRTQILSVERYIWEHPETGYREWNTSRYLEQIFEQAGYTLTKPGDIPGFYTDVDTGRPGPKILILGELDALAAPTHPEAVNGCAHACGHNAQCAALVGVALALKEPGALDGLCGSIRLMAVPAEEMIELEYRQSLRKKGIIRYFGGKVEYMYRGYMDGVDIVYMNHVRPSATKVVDFINSDGFITKDVVYEGVASHAGGCPQLGVNALYAATIGLTGINAIRETFTEPDLIRVHPIMTNGGDCANIIPAQSRISTYVRGSTFDAIRQTSAKVNRALAAGALAVGAKLHITDHPGYAPLLNDRGLTEVANRVAGELVGPENVEDSGWETGSTDMGDLSCVYRALHVHIAGASGQAHGDNYRITDPETCCVTSAVMELSLAAELLMNDAAAAKEVLAGPPLRYPNKEAYFEDIDRFDRAWDLIAYDGNTAAVTF
ncbi:MAG: amidohydrolase [Candidatus Avoscillospira sp.]